MKLIRRALTVAALATATIATTAATAAEASGDTPWCERGLPAISVRIPGTTSYATFGPGLSRLTSQTVSSPQDPGVPGMYFQVAEAYAKPGRKIVETITYTTGSIPQWDYWGGGQDYVHITFVFSSEDGNLVESMLNCVE